MPRNVGVVLTASLLTLVLAGPLAADEPPGDAAPLSGPKVSPAKDSVRTLVQRDFDGGLKRLEGDPIAAALDLLALPAEVRAEADGLIARRAAAFDDLVRDNLKQIAELSSARQAGDAPRARELTREMLQKAAPILEGGPMLDQVARTLPAAEGEELKRLVNDYTQAAADDRRERGMEEPGEGQRRRPGGRMQAAMAERLRGFGMEIKWAYERVFASRSREFQETIKELGLSPEQESRVQQIFTDLFQKTYGKPTRQQSSKAFMEAYALLDPEQRDKLRQIMAGRREKGQERDVPREVPTPNG